MNEVIPDTTKAGTASEFLPNFTATTERGCILLMQPRHISLIITSILMTLIEPEVEAAHPPMNIRVKSVIWQTAGHTIYGERVYPDVVAILMTWKNESLKADSKPVSLYTMRPKVQMIIAAVIIIT